MRLMPSAVARSHERSLHRCHGDIADVNPHGGYDVTDDTGLIAGRTLKFLTRDNEITCLSCTPNIRAGWSI